MKRQKKKKTLAFKNAVAGYLFILPFILGFILFMVVPLISSLRMTFNDVTPVAGEGVKMTWVGIKNYKDAFTVDPDFVPYLLSELLRMVVNTPATLIFSFFIALLLNQNFKGRGFVRAIFFLPVILSSGVIVGIEYNNELLNDMKDMISETSNDASVTGALDSYLDVRGIAKKATTAYSQGMIATGTLMVILPLIIIYLFAQKGFVESLSQSGIKM